MRQSHFPAMCVYNMNHMGKSSEFRRNSRLNILRQLLAKHKIVGLQELHANSQAEAEIFSCFAKSAFF